MTPKGSQHLYALGLQEWMDWMDLFQDVAVLLVHTKNIKITWKGDLGANEMV